MNKKIRTGTALICAFLLLASVGFTSAKYVRQISDEFSVDIAAAFYRLIAHANSTRASFADGTSEKAFQQTTSNFFDLSGHLPEHSDGFYKFIGWSYDSDSSTVDFQNSSRVIARQPGVTEHVYAIWGRDIGAFTNLAPDDKDNTEEWGEAAEEGLVVGVGDDIVFQLLAGNYTYERIFVPLWDGTENPDPDYSYELTFSYDGYGSYRNFPAGVYGYQVIDEATKNQYMNKRYFMGTGDDSTNLDIVLHIPEGFVFLGGIEDKPLNSIGDFEIRNSSQSYFFTPNGGPMYFCLEYSDMNDNDVTYHYMKNFQLHKAYPSVNPTGGIVTNKKTLPNGQSFTMEGKHSQWERFGILIPEELTTGQTYKVSFKLDTNASVNPASADYFGYQVTSSKSVFSSSEKVVRDNYWNPLQTGYNTYEMVFTADAEKMYLAFETSSVQDLTPYNYKITDISVEPADIAEATNLSGSSHPSMSVQPDVIKDPDMETQPDHNDSAELPDSADPLPNQEAVVTPDQEDTDTSKEPAEEITAGDSTPPPADIPSADSQGSVAMPEEPYAADPKDGEATMTSGEESQSPDDSDSGDPQM